MGADVVTLDPAGQQDTTSGVLIHHVYSTLMDIDEEGNLVPDLAESYEMKSDTEYTFKLREDACFSDGTPVTAKDVKFTYDRAKDMPKTKSNTSKIAEVIADDDYHVTFKLHTAIAAFKTIVTQTNLKVSFLRAAVTAAGDAYDDVDNVLGSGEFHGYGVGSERSLHPWQRTKILGYRTDRNFHYRPRNPGGKCKEPLLLRQGGRPCMER